MKIWYQSFSFASPDPSESYPRILRESMSALLDEGTELTFGNMTRSIPSGHHMHVVQTYDIPEMLRNLVLAEQNGYDAVIIGNALDPGLFDARSLLRIPVLSIGQSALLFSQQIGTKALVIASGRKAIPIVRENIRRFGLGEGVQDVISAAGDLSVKQMTSAFDDAELQKAVAVEPRLVHFVAQTADIQAAKSVLKLQGIDRGTAVEASRHTRKGRLEWKITVRDDGQRLFNGTLPSLIQWGKNADADPLRLHPRNTLPRSGVSLQSVAVSSLSSDKLQAA